MPKPRAAPWRAAVLCRFALAVSHPKRQVTGAVQNNRRPGPAAGGHFRHKPLGAVVDGARPRAPVPRRRPGPAALHLRHKPPSIGKGSSRRNAAKEHKERKRNERWRPHSQPLDAGSIPHIRFICTLLALCVLCVLSRLTSVGPQSPARTTRLVQPKRRREGGRCPVSVKGRFWGALWSRGGLCADRLPQPFVEPSQACSR